MNDRQLITLVATIGTCCLVSLERTIPEHTRKARAIRKVEESIKELASLTGCIVSKETVDVGLKAWNAAMNAVQEGMQ